MQNYVMWPLWCNCTLVQNLKSSHVIYRNACVNELYPIILKPYPWELSIHTCWEKVQGNENSFIGFQENLNYWWPWTFWQVNLEHDISLLTEKNEVLGNNYEEDIYVIVLISRKLELYFDIMASYWHRIMRYYHFEYQICLPELPKTFFINFSDIFELLYDTLTYGTIRGLDTNLYFDFPW